MRIAKIELLNWMRFKGQHSLKLEAKAYAVVASYPQNPERSNWLGKTSFLESIDFALWGRHQFRTEDAWISHGESVGEVRLTMDNGAIILRRRERGKRTSLCYNGPEIQGGATQDEAQRLIQEVVGIDQDDFVATCFFKQKKMSRLIIAKPEERMDIVSGWIRLGPLEKCDEKVRAEVSTLSNQLQQMEAQLQSLADMETHALNGETRENIEKTLKNHAKTLEEIRGKYATAQNAVVSNSRLLGAAGKIEAFDELVRDGKALRDSLAGYDIKSMRAAHLEANTELTECSIRLRSATVSMQEKKSLSKGEFDGVCPVAGIQCPAKTDINKDRKRGLQLFDEAQVVFEEANEATSAAKEREYKTRTAVQEYDRKESKLQSMREQVARLEPEYEEAIKAGAPLDQHDLRAKSEALAGRLDAAMQNEKRMQSTLEQLDGIAQRRVSLTNGIAEIRKHVEAYREAALVFGKQGAQRRLAEGALSEIEDGANSLLRDASIDLSIAVQWSREGNGLARVCDACGNPFPASTRVKVCTRCNAGRGPLLINKLDFDLSDRSGAAEDLAGIALQLSASAWLRTERGSLWETAILDEPFGALDSWNRKSLGRHLASLLSGKYGFTQSFVVAHTPDVLASLPGRIEIVGNPTGSTIRVIA